MIPRPIRESLGVLFQVPRHGAQKLGIYQVMCHCLRNSRAPNDWSRNVKRENDMHAAKQILEQSGPRLAVRGTSYTSLGN
jgi:hypothetical protein